LAPFRGVVRLHRLQDESRPSQQAGLGRGRRDVDAVVLLQNVEHELAVVVPDDDALVVFVHLGGAVVRRAHVPDDNVGQVVGVQEAAHAGRCDDVDEVIGRQTEVWNLLVGTVSQLEMNAVVLHKL